MCDSSAFTGEFSLFIIEAADERSYRYYITFLTAANTYPTLLVVVQFQSIYPYLISAFRLEY